MSLWEGDQVLCRLCEGLFGRASMGYGDTNIVGEGCPVRRCNERFDEGIIIIYGGEKGLEGMGF